MNFLGQDNCKAPLAIEDGRTAAQQRAYYHALHRDQKLAAKRAAEVQPDDFDDDAYGPFLPF